MKISSSFRKTVVLLIVIILLFQLLPGSWTGYASGKEYNTNRDYSCCNGDQLIIHHYYDVHLFWITINSGYTKEPIEKLSKAGCLVQCNE